MKLAKLLTIIFLLSITGNIHAQDWARVIRHYNTYGAKWSFPYELEQVSYFDFSQDGQKLYIHPNVDGEVENQDITFDVKSLDNIEFVDETPEEEQTHDKYKVFTLNITTENGVSVRSKEEYVNYRSRVCSAEYIDPDGNIHMGVNRSFAVRDTDGTYRLRDEMLNWLHENPDLLVSIYDIHI